jgi:hypothetical protein
MNSTKPTTLFWVLGVLFLLWNAFGCYIYVIDKTASDAALLARENGEAVLAAYKAYPVWASAAYAIAVWGGLIASVMLLLRKKLSMKIFILSLVAAIICFIPTYTAPEMKAAYGPTYWLMPLIVIALGAFEVLWSRAKAADGMLT